MAEIETGMLPKALAVSVKRFAGARRRVRLTLSSGSTTLTNGDILRVRLPRGLVDLASFGFNADLATQDTSNKIPANYAMVRRCGATIGGVNVGFQNNSWAQTAHAMNIAGQSLEYDRGNMTGVPLPTRQLGNGDHVEFNYWPLSPMTAGMLHTELTGQAEIDIQFNGLECLTDPSGGSIGTSYTLSNVFAYVDVIDLEDDGYEKTLVSALKAGSTYQKCMDLATAVVQQNTSTNNFNVSCSSLQKVIVAPKDNDYNTAAVQGEGVAYSRFLDFPSGESTTGSGAGIYVQIGSQSFPQYGFGQKYIELAQITRQAMGGASPYNYNKLYLGASSNGSLASGATLSYAPTNYVSRNGVVVFDVGAFDEHGKQGGIDLSSGNSVIRVESQGSNLTSSRKLLMAGVHKSVVQVKEGQIVGLQL